MFQIFKSTLKSLKSSLILVLLLSISMLISNSSLAQNKKVLLSIGDENVKVGEFKNVYEKSNSQGDVIDKKSMEEYLDLYINFKLKVKEALDLRMDTNSAFISELGGYREQLAKPYFVDESINEDLFAEAWDRKQKDVRASHILIRIDENASAEDTLIAYNKLMDIRKRIMNGEDFGDVAVETSEDPSARDREATGRRPFMRGNKGDLGYFSVFDMVYPFESGAYNSEIGDITMPVRTQFGYHLIKLTDKKSAMGQAQVAHIYFMIPPSATAADSARVEKKANKVYQEILDGKAYNDAVAEYSEDKGSAKTGGILPWFGVNRMVPEFIEIVYQLNDSGDIAKPLLTAYGWHIVQLKGKKPIKTYDEIKDELKKKVLKDSRAEKSKDIIVEKIKRDFKFKEYSKAKNSFYTVVDSSILIGKWEISNADGLEKVLFKIGDKKYSQKDFADYLFSNQKNQTRIATDIYVNKEYDKFVNEICLDYFDSNLEEIYPEFDILMKEYRDGILLFELTDEKVWSKAIKDTTGLKEFYNNNKNNYIWDERLDASVYTIRDSEIVDDVQAKVNEGVSDNEILLLYNNDSITNVAILSDKFLRGDNKIIDSIKWKVGNSKDIITDEEISFVLVRDILPPQIKEMNEARGLIIADYQNYLEAEWIKLLKEKYNVKINKKVLSNLE